MRIITLLFCVLIFSTLNAQINLKKLKNISVKAETLINSNELSKSEVIKGLREALILGSIKATAFASKPNSFNSDLHIRILFPDDAKEMKTALLRVGMKSEVDKFEVTLNSAAEEASNFAKDIFIDAIRKMTISDGLTILKGKDNAATSYLKSQTADELYLKFKPIVKKAIAKVELTRHWGILSQTYNGLPFTKKINTDLEDYIVNKAISGLFILIEKEEKEIRNNPYARVSDILKKVFK
tara:strand:+ start:1385 stop:2104 length:720 start_codon:yes stop_codon:yes gene_type:complete